MTRPFNHLKHSKIPINKNSILQTPHKGLSFLFFGFHHIHLRYTHTQNSYSTKSISTFKMPPKRRPPPKSLAPPKSKKFRLDNVALETSVSTTANISAASNDLSLISTSAKDGSAASGSQLPFETQDNTLRMFTQEDQLQLVPPGYALFGNNMAVKNGPNNQQNRFNYEPAWQTSCT